MCRGFDSLPGHQQIKPVMVKQVMGTLRSAHFCFVCLFHPTFASGFSVEPLSEPLGDVLAYPRKSPFFPGLPSHPSHLGIDTSISLRIALIDMLEKHRAFLRVERAFITFRQHF